MVHGRLVPYSPSVGFEIDRRRLEADFVDYGRRALGPSVGRLDTKLHAPSSWNEEDLILEFMCKIANTGQLLP